MSIPLGVVRQCLAISIIHLLQAATHCQHSKGDCHAQHNLPHDKDDKGHHIGEEDNSRGLTAGWP